LHLEKYASFVYTDQSALERIYFGLRALVGPGRLLVEVSRLHSARHTTLGRTTVHDPVAETST
jgi:hypothetical protein